MRYARKQAGLTIRQLSKISGVDSTTIGFIENGRSQGNISTIEMLADALGLSIDEYIGHKVAPRKPSDIERFFGGK